MKRHVILAAFLVASSGLACTAFAAEEAPKPPPDLVDAPPPSLTDPGVKTAPAETAADKAKAGSGKGADADANGIPPPEVGIRKQGDDTIEEYRKAGKVSMIRITGKSGITQTYIDTDGDGRLEGNPKEGPVAPVYYKLYEWN